MRRLNDYPAIAVAAALGAAVRLAFAEALEPTWFSTTTVNLVACLAAGLAIRWIADSERLRRVITAGLLGGLSTFATLTEDLRQLVASGDTGPLLLAFAAAVIGCPAVFLLARGRPGE
ncbi:MAG: CrcB family protein [Ilumatobacteraceae bacterium]